VHALSGQRRLHLLVGEVQVQPARRLESGHAVLAQPMAPARNSALDGGRLPQAACGRRDRPARPAMAPGRARACSAKARPTTGVTTSPNSRVAPPARRRGGNSATRGRCRIVEVGHRVAGRQADVDVAMLALDEASRGSSHNDANDAKVVMLTWRRPRALRICRTVVSSRCSSGTTPRSNWLPAPVSSTRRVPRRNSGAPNSSSRPLIWRLMAGWVRCSSSAAAEKLARRATASKARSGPTASARWIGLFITISHQWVARFSFDFAPPCADDSALLKHIQEPDMEQLLMQYPQRWVAPRPAWLRVQAGMLWVTRSGDPEDHVLVRGERLAIARGDDLVLQAWCRDVPAVWDWQPMRAPSHYRLRRALPGLAWRPAHGPCAVLRMAWPPSRAVRRPGQPGPRLHFRRRLHRRRRRRPVAHRDRLALGRGNAGLPQVFQRPVGTAVARRGDLGVDR